MSDENQSAKASWNSAQVYAMSLLCLLVGVSVGYLFRGSTASPAARTPSVVVQQQTPGGSPQSGGMPAGQPGPEQLKAMADKKIAPLLDELKKNPNDTDTLTKVGGFYFAVRQFDEAASYFERSVKIKPSPDALTKLSNAYFYGGNTDKAIATLNQALQMDPKFANALYNLGMIKWQGKGDVKGAIACWETLVKTNPHHPQIDQVKQMIARAKEHEKMPAGTKTDKPAM